MSQSRVLLSEVGSFRPTTINGVSCRILDYSALEFQIEELISIGASYIAVAQPLPDEAVAALVPALRKRIVEVDVCGSALATARSIIVPMCEELGIHIDGLPDLNILEVATAWKATRGLR